MELKIAINGMGVIGRELFRTLWGDERFAIMLINDFVTPQNLKYLLMHDSIYHNWVNMPISVSEESITVDGKEIPLYHKEDVENLPLGEIGVDVVLECSGNFNKEKMERFLAAGAKRVISCYSAGNDLPTIVYGVNENTLNNGHDVVAFAEMETQVLASVLKTLNTGFGIETAICKAFRPYTNSQPTMDSFDTKQMARGRAAAWNITPLSDSSAKSIGLSVPELNGKVIGMAYRAPVINGGFMDITAVLNGNVSVKQINACLKANSSESMGYSEEYLCSSDALGFERPQALANNTMVTYSSDGKILANISVVYDGVRGYCLQMARFLTWAMYSGTWL